MRSLTLAILIAVLGARVEGQIITGSIVGTVKDTTGAVLPGVSIVVKNLERNQVRNALTNETGTYSIPLLPFGKYKVTAEFTSFKSQVKTGIELQVEQRLNINFVLEVGAVSERVIVTEAAPLVQ